MKGKLVLLLIVGEIKDTQRKDAKRAVEICEMYKIQQKEQSNEKINWKLQILMKIL